ncbi:MAG TPA: hypothetical protein VGL48_00310 [Acidimicrobiales bacterium]|jgi:hypothetical protein
MSMATRYQENLEKGVAALIDGPLVVATIGSPVGSMSRLFTSEAFKLGMSAAGGDGTFTVSGSTRGRVEQPEGKDIRLPQSFAVALTGSSVYFFKWKPFWGRVKIKKELARIPREGLRVRVTQGKATATVFLLLSETTGMRVAFEMATLGMAKAKEKVAEVVGAFVPETA